MGSPPKFNRQAAVGNRNWLGKTLCVMRSVRMCQVHLNHALGGLLSALRFFTDEETPFLLVCLQRFHTPQFHLASFHSLWACAPYKWVMVRRTISKWLNALALWLRNLRGLLIMPGYKNNRIRLYAYIPPTLGSQIAVLTSLLIYRQTFSPFFIVKDLQCCLLTLVTKEPHTRSFHTQSAYADILSSHYREYEV